MILKKPYAFIIKYFKLIHVIVSFFLAYMIYRTNLILNFLSSYISSTTSVVGQDLTNKLFNIGVFIIPVVLVLFSLVFFGIMYSKKKSFTFYIVNTFIYIILLIILAYSYGVIYKMQSTILDIGSIRIIHDLLILLLGVESVSFVVFFTRGIGFDVTKFDFLQDINKLEISEDDKEEFELDIKIDLDEKKRKRIRFKRYLKYTYKENKLFINIIGLLALFIITYFVFTSFDFKTNDKEGIIYSKDGLFIGVDESYITNKSYTQKTITDKYLVIAKIKVKTYLTDKRLITNAFKLHIDKKEYLMTTDYFNSLIDLGYTYNKEEIESDYKYYLVTFEIDKKLVNSKMVLTYNKNLNVELKPLKIDTDLKTTKYKLKDKVNITNNLLRGINISVNSYEINDIFKIQYNFKLNKDVYPSIEYIKPKLNTNYDKTLLKINSTFNMDKNESNSIKTFEELITNYTYIKYVIDKKTYITRPVTLVKSAKLIQQDIYYLEVNRDIKNAKSASLVVKCRDKEYEIILF